MKGKIFPKGDRKLDLLLLFRLRGQMITPRLFYNCRYNARVYSLPMLHLVETALEPLLDFLDRDLSNKKTATIEVRTI